LPLSEKPSEIKPQWHPHAAAAGWIVPGLGHLILGQKKRGIILCVSILSLWLAGIFIGGISVIDKYDRVDSDVSSAKPTRSWWFFGQAMIAPSFVVDVMRERMAVAHAKALGYPNHANPRGLLDPVSATSASTLAPPYEPSFGRVAEQGILYTALAGMLNLLAMIDVLYCDPNARRRAVASQASDPVPAAEPIAS